MMTTKMNGNTQAMANPPAIAWHTLFQNGDSLVKSRLFFRAAAVGAFGLGKQAPPFLFVEVLE